MERGYVMKKRPGMGDPSAGGNGRPAATPFELSIGDDYPLTGVLTYFEAYMFVTTPKHMAEHRFIASNGVERLDGCVHVVDGIMGDNMSMNPAALAKATGSFAMRNPDLPCRKALLSLFNSIGVRRGLGNPKPGGFSCVLIDFRDPSGLYDPAAIRATADRICRLFAEWCAANDRAGAIAQHLAQGNRLPHVHALYQRGKGKHEEFQDWLRARILADFA